MARIRTIKPETFTSEMLADLPVTVRWTFVGLWTYVDDEGRGRGDARLVKAAVWPLDDEVTAAVVDEHLDQLAAKRAVCRYEVEGKRYLHVVNFAEHQHPNRPVASKLPECPRTAHGGRTDDAVSTHADAEAGGVNRHDNGQTGVGNTGVSGNHGRVAGNGVYTGRPAHEQLTESAVRTHTQLIPVGEGSGVGGELGAPRGRASSVRATPPMTTTRGQQILDDHLAACQARPPRDVIGRTGEAIEKLLDERFECDQVKAGLALMRGRPRCGPGLLPDLVHEAVTAGASPSRRQHTDEAMFDRALTRARARQEVSR